jgi:hypothetical protein
MTKNANRPLTWLTNFIRIILALPFVLMLNSCSKVGNHEFRIKTLSEKSAEGLPYYSNPVRGVFLEENRCFYNKDKHALIWYNFNTNQSSVILLNNSIFPRKIHSISDHFFVNTRASIFFLSTESNTVSLFDSDLNFQNEKHLLRRYSLAVNESSFLIMGRSLLYTWFHKEMNFGKKDMRLKCYKDVNPICSFPLDNSDSNIISTFSSYPDLYKKTGNDYYNFFPYVNIAADGRIVISYSADAFVYVFEDEKFLFKKECKSNYVDVINDVPDDKIMNLVYIRKYQIEEPKYLSVVYDEYQHRYYRKLKVKFNSQNLAESQWSIIIMDEDFDVIGEVLLKYSDYDPDILIPTSNGVLLKRTKSNDENMVLSLVKFEK